MAMTKRLLALILSLCLCLSMIPAAAAEDIEIVETNEYADDLALTSEDGSIGIKVWVSDQIADHTRQKIQEFNENNTLGLTFDATVESVAESAVYDMLATEEDAADLFVFPQDQLANIVRGGYLDELSQDAAQAVREKNAANSVLAVTYHDELYAYPLTEDNGYFMYYDKSIVPERDLDSIEDILYDCQRWGKEFYFEVESGWYLASYFFGAGCVSTFEPNEDVWDYTDTFSSEQGLIAARGLKELTWSSAFVNSSEGSAFSEGNAAVLISGVWNYNQVREALGDNFGATDLPSYTVDGTSYHLGSFSGCKLMGVKPQEDADRAAALHALAQYLSDGEAQLERFQIAGWGPSDLDAQADPDVQADPALAALLKQSAYATPQGQIPSCWWNLTTELFMAIRDADWESQMQEALERYSRELGAEINPTLVIASGECGENLTWTLNQAGTLTISGTGEMGVYDYGAWPWSELTDRIKTVIVGEGATNIGDYAFAECEQLTDVTLPDSVIRIGNQAFAGCNALTGFYIPAGVTRIVQTAFNHCFALTAFTVSEDNADYSALDGVLFNQDQTALILCPAGWAGDYVIPDGVTDIEENAFYHCDGLSAVTIPDSVTSIGNMAFYCCQGLEDVTIGSGVTSIGGSTFGSCSKLKSVTLGSNVTSLGIYVFYLCSSLETVTIPESVTRIDAYCFEGCGALKQVFYGGYEEAVAYLKNNSWSTRENDAFFNAEWHYAKTLEEGWGLCGLNLLWHLDADSGVLTIKGSGDMWDYYAHTAATRPWKDSLEEIAAVVIEDGATKIGSYAFSGCSNLADVTIPESVTSIGSYAFSECGSLTEATIPDGIHYIYDNTFFRCGSLERVTIPDSVTYIGDYAFYECGSLSDAVIPDSVLNLGMSVFSGCSSLTDIRIPSGLKTIPYGLFSHCGMTELVIPDTVTVIKEYTFSSCSNLKSIVVGSGVTSIGSGAFSQNGSLEEVRFTGPAPAIEEYCFYTVDTTAYYPADDPSWTEDVRKDYGGHITWVAYTPVEIVANGQCGDDLYWTLDENGTLRITGTGDMWDFNWNTSPWIDEKSSIQTVVFENGVTSIGDYTFCNSSNLTSVLIPEGVTSIGASAFYFSGLTSVTIPDSVTSIGRFAFSSCGDLTSVTIGNSVASIGEHAFDCCGGLTSVSIPASVTSIGDAVFASCGHLTEIIVAEDNLNYSSADGVLFDKMRTVLIQYPAGKEGSDYTVPDGVTSIGSNAFNHCSSLTSVTIPESVTSIGGLAFTYCSGLTSMTIPEGVVSVGNQAFHECTALTSVMIPDSMMSIGNFAFAGCGSLTEIRFAGSAPTFGDGCFGGVTATAYYPVDDESWTEDVRQGYNGRITWVEYSERFCLNTHEITLVINSSVLLYAMDSHGPAHNVSWISSKPEIATVDENGMVTAKKYGLLEIYAVAEDGSIDSCLVQTLFSDVTDSSKYYYEPVYWAADNEITVGYTSGEYNGMFGVGQNCERRQLMLFLWRYAGSPTKDKNGKAYPDAKTLFNDVGAYSASSGTNKAIAWAYTEGIAKGYKDGGFHPTAPIVRKDVMIMLYRLAGKPAVSGTLSFPDCKDMKPGTDTYNAILWGVQKGITKGYSSGEYAGQFGTNLDCLREQIVTFLYRYAEKYS